MLLTFICVDPRPSVVPMFFPDVSRALRGWVYRAARNQDSTIPFGSTRDVSPVGSISFVNCPCPTLDVDAVPTKTMIIGPDCAHPFKAESLFNISGMSYGALDGLVGYGLRERVRVICSGKLITPSGVAWALCMGADFIVSARGFMFALGCIQAMQYHKNTCPTGITTHQKRLQRGLDPQDKAVRVAHYVENMRHDVGVIAHSCGVKHLRQLQRRHARVVTNDGSSAGLHIIHPETENGFPHGKE